MVRAKVEVGPRYAGKASQKTKALGTWLLYQCEKERQEGAMHEVRKGGWSTRLTKSHSPKDETACRQRAGVSGLLDPIIHC